VIVIWPAAGLPIMETSRKVARLWHNSHHPMGSGSSLSEKPLDGIRDPQAVRAEVARILDHPSFKQSERCTKLLRFLAESSLSEHGCHLKERTIGHEVFGRDPDYDTYSDPVVRNAASEVRRRLREYYHQHDSSKLRIEFPSGRYLLHFIAVDETPEIEPPVEALVTVTKPPFPDPLPSPPVPARRVSLWRYLAVIAIALAAFAAGHYLHQAPEKNAFWDGVFAAKAPFILSLNTHKGEDGIPDKRYLFSLPEASAYSTVAAFLQNHNAKFWMKPDVDTGLEDIRNNLTIIIGNMTHIWIPRLEGQFRYQCVYDANNKVGYLKDTFHPASLWREGPDASYGMVARFTSPITGGTVIMLSGGRGVASAAEFVTDPRYRNTLNDILARSKNNIQIILKSRVIGDNVGSPEVVAVYTW
jgi:hypothetical protein